MFIDLLKRRRSVRAFAPKPLSPVQIETLLEAGLRSPSSRRIDPWEYIVITDSDVLRRLSVAKSGADFLAGAAAAIVIVADTEKSDVWVEDCSIAATNIWLTATDLDLGACWAQIRNRRHSDTLTAEEYVRSLLQIPSRYAVEAIIGVGYPATRGDADTSATGANQTDEGSPEWSKVHHGRFQV